MSHLPLVAGMDAILLELYRLLSPAMKRKLLSEAAELVCEQLPMNSFTMPDDDLKNEEEDSTDSKITAVLKQTIPWNCEATQHVGDHFLDALDRALGDDPDSWPQALGGWNGDDQTLVEELTESIKISSEDYPGFPPNWQSGELQDFLDSWRQAFFIRLISIAKNN